VQELAAAQTHRDASAASDLCGIFRVGFADRGVWVLRRLHRFLDGRRGWLGRGAELESCQRWHTRLHVNQMPELSEWKPGLMP
jgi:hypothetical protein